MSTLIGTVNTSQSLSVTIQSNQLYVTMSPSIPSNFDGWAYSFDGSLYHVLLDEDPQTVTYSAYGNHTLYFRGVNVINSEEILDDETVSINFDIAQNINSTVAINTEDSSKEAVEIKTFDSKSLSQTQISENGKYLTVGSSGADSGGFTNNGEIKMYKVIGGDDLQLEHTFYGDSNEEKIFFGKISNSGTRALIRRNENSETRTYEYSNGSWNDLGDDFKINAIGSLFDKDLETMMVNKDIYVSNSSGWTKNTLETPSESFPEWEWVVPPGQAHSNGSYQLTGNFLEKEYTFLKSALSSDGNYACAAWSLSGRYQTSTTDPNQYNLPQNLSTTYLIRVYEKSSNWSQIGQDITSVPTSSLYGFSIDISGLNLAVSYELDRFLPKVKVFSYDSSAGTWSQRGDAITSDVGTKDWMIESWKIANGINIFGSSSGRSQYFHDTEIVSDGVKVDYPSGEVNTSVVDGYKTTYQLSSLRTTGPFREKTSFGKCVKISSDGKTLLVTEPGHEMPIPSGSYTAQMLNLPRAVIVKYDSSGDSWQTQEVINDVSDNVLTSGDFDIIIHDRKTRYYFGIYDNQSSHSTRTNQVSIRNLRDTATPQTVTIESSASLLSDDSSDNHDNIEACSGNGKRILIRYLNPNIGYIPHIKVLHHDENDGFKEHSTLNSRLYSLMQDSYTSLKQLDHIMSEDGNKILVFRPAETSAYGGNASIRVDSYIGIFEYKTGFGWAFHSSINVGSVRVSNIFASGDLNTILIKEVNADGEKHVNPLYDAHPNEGGQLTKTRLRLFKYDSDWTSLNFDNFYTPQTYTNTPRFWDYSTLSTRSSANSWNVGSGHYSRTVSKLFSVTLSYDGSTIAVVDYENEHIKCFEHSSGSISQKGDAISFSDFELGQQYDANASLTNWEGAQYAGVFGAFLSPDGSRLAIHTDDDNGGSGGSLYFLKFQSGNWSHEFRKNHQGETNNLDTSYSTTKTHAKTIESHLGAGVEFKTNSVFKLGSKIFNIVDQEAILVADNLVGNINAASQLLSFKKEDDNTIKAYGSRQYEDFTSTVPALSQETNSTLLGNSLEGEYPNETDKLYLSEKGVPSKIGNAYRTAFSKNGNFIAYVEPFRQKLMQNPNDTSGSWIGKDSEYFPAKLKIFEYNSTNDSLSQVGDDIDEPGVGSYQSKDSLNYNADRYNSTDFPNFGAGINEVALSDDGKTVFFSGPYARDPDDTSSVLPVRKVMKYENNAWVQVGNLMRETNPGTYNGTYAMSGDGSTIAYSETTPSRQGKTKVFKLINNTWTQLGGVIEGDGDQDKLQVSNLNSDGTVILLVKADAIHSFGVRVCDMSSDGATILTQGSPDSFKILEYTNGSWSQKGSGWNSGWTETNQRISIYKFENNSWEEKGFMTGGKSSVSNSTTISAALGIVGLSSEDLTFFATQRIPNATVSSYANHPEPDLTNNSTPNMAFTVLIKFKFNQNLNTFEEVGYWGIGSGHYLVNEDLAGLSNSSQNHARRKYTTSQKQNLPYDIFDMAEVYISSDGSRAMFSNDSFENISNYDDTHSVSYSFEEEGNRGKISLIKLS